MNILFLTKELPYPPNNGHKVRTFHILKGLEQNNRVSLVCAEEKSIPKRNLYWLAIFGLFSLIPFAVKRRYSPSLRGQIDKLLEKNNIDLIFCESVYQALHIPHNTPNKVLCEQNIESMIIYRYFRLERNIFKKIYAFIEFLKMRRFENKMWKRFNHCFAVSEKDKEIMASRINKENISVIPNGVDVNYFCPQNIKVRPFSLIYTGQMNWYPNEDAVIYFLTKIYPLIKREIPQVSFWIVGNSPAEKIKKLARDDKSIVITGFVEDIRPFIAGAEVFIVPLRIGSGTRLKILEAMSMEKPIVSTSIGCEGLDVNHLENIIIADEPQYFAGSIIELFENPALGTRLGIAGRRLVEKKYSWDRIIERLNCAVRQLNNTP